MLHLLPGSFILIRHLFAKRRRFAASRFLKHFVFLLVVCCWMLPLTAEAAPLAEGGEAVEVAQAAAPSDSELMLVDGRQVEFAVTRAPQARATVVFENGLMLPMSTWQAVRSSLADSFHTVTYNRAGVGRSAMAPDPQPPQSSVGDGLLALLKSQQLDPPYILVGHSLGGQYAQLFASLHPDLVSGLVLVDALPVGTVKPAAEFPWFTRWGLWLFAPEYARREIANIHPMGEALLAAARLEGRPVVRLVAHSQATAPKAEGLVKDLLKGVVLAEDFGVWAVDPEVAERRMDELYPQSIVKPVQAHHRVQELAPELVVEAIRQVAGCCPVPLAR